MTCQPASMNTYTVMVHQRRYSILLYAGHYHCCALKKIDEHKRSSRSVRSFTLSIWHGGKIIETIHYDEHGDVRSDKT